MRQLNKYKLSIVAVNMVSYAYHKDFPNQINFKEFHRVKDMRKDRAGALGLKGLNTCKINGCLGVLRFH